jgi:tRNA A-37 threonylcarbamoyl transferase component Bud32
MMLRRTRSMYLRPAYPRTADRRHLTVKNRFLTRGMATLLSSQKASLGRWQLLGVPSEILGHHFGRLHLSLLLHHLFSSPHFIHAIVRGCPGLLVFFTFPLLAMCAVKSPILEGLISPDIRARLSSILSMHLSINDLTIQPMRRRPGSRHVFSYKLVVGDQRTGKQKMVELVAKRDTTRAAGKAAKEFEAMRLLWDAGFGQDRTLTIPQPLHHFADLQLIVQEKARGTRFRNFLGDDSHASVDHARKVGVWLAKLHNLPAASGQVCSYASEKTSLQMFVSAISASQPRLEPDLRLYASMMEQYFDSFKDVAATYVHGDFHPDHIFVANDRVTVIDFERFCIGDPARDLGSFIAHVRTTAGLKRKSIEAANQQNKVFLHSYLSNVAEEQRIPIAARIAPFVGLSSIEAIYYVANVLHVTQPAVIDMYMNCLHQGELSPAPASPPPTAKSVSSTHPTELSGELA